MKLIFQIGTYILRKLDEIIFREIFASNRVKKIYSRQFLLSGEDNSQKTVEIKKIENQD